MEADTKEMVQRLQRRPADLALFEEVKARLRAERRHKSFVKVVRWWAKRAPTKAQAAQALFEAGEVAQRDIKDVDQAKELFEAALECDPGHEAATAALSGLTPDEEFDDLLDGLDNESIRPPSLRPSDRPPADADGAGGRLPSVGPPPRRPSARPPPGSLATSASPVPLPAPPPSVGGAPPATGTADGLFSAQQDDLFKVDPPASPPLHEPIPPAAALPSEVQEDDPTGRFASDPPPAAVVQAAPAVPASGPSAAVGAAALAAPADGTEPALFDDDDDEEDDGSPAHFPIASILGDGSSPTESKGGKTSLEIVRRRGETVVGASHVRFLGRAGGDAIRVRRVGTTSYNVKLADGVAGWVSRAAAGPGAGREGLPDGPLRLDFGDVAEVVHAGVVNQLRVTRAAPPPLASSQPVPMTRYGVVVVSAVGIHVLGLALIASLASVGVNFRVETRSRDEIFAEARLKPEEKRAKPKLKKPKPVKLRKRKAPKPTPTEEKASIPKSLRKKLRKIARKRDTQNTNAVDRLVNSLKSPVAGEGKTLKDVVSNIDAIKGGEASGAFKIGGTLSALDGKGPNIVSGGGGDIGTLGGSEATGKLARLKGKKGKGVRGKVTSVKALAKIQGSLSRGEVLKVLNKNQHKIQRCYERALLAKPSLAGRLTYTWTIKTSGRVGSVQNTGNTLGDTKVGKCIGGVIKGMKFPRPKGGPVTVTFPWIFKRAM